MKALARLRKRADSPELTLLDFVISTRTHKLAKLFSIEKFGCLVTDKKFDALQQSLIVRQ